jgi:hypothetical protein
MLSVSGRARVLKVYIKTENSRNWSRPLHGRLRCIVAHSHCGGSGGFHLEQVIVVRSLEKCSMYCATLLIV